MNNIQRVIDDSNKKFDEKFTSVWSSKHGELIRIPDGIKENIKSHISETIRKDKCEAKGGDFSIVEDYQYPGIIVDITTCKTPTVDKLNERIVALEERINKVSYYALTEQNVRHIANQQIFQVLQAVEEEVERKLHSSRPIPTEVETDTARCVKEIHKMLSQTILSPNPDDNLIKTASMYVERYEEEQRSRYVRYLENKIQSALSDIQSLLKSAKENIK